MKRPVSEIEAELRSLNRPDQERLLSVLLEALDGPADPEAELAWLDEVRRRSAEIDAGDVAPIPAEEVFAHLRARLRK